MKVDPSKINLAEKDIEDWLWEHPGSVSWEDDAQRDSGEVVYWTERQLRVPSGIIDLLGMDENGNAVVVEIKNVPLDASAITQVKRYAFDIRSTMDLSGLEQPSVFSVIVGKSIDDRTMREAEACDVHVITFKVNFDLNTSRMGWTKQYEQERVQAYQTLGNSDAMDGFKGYFEAEANMNRPDTEPDADQAAAQIVADYEERTQPPEA